MFFNNNNTETEYTSVGTYLCLLFHIVAFGIKVLVPWLLFVYMWPLTALFRSSSFAKSLPARCSFIFGNRKKSDSARSGLYGGCSKMSQWNFSRSKACVCRAVCGRALSCNRTIPRESLPLRQDNLRSHRPAENEQLAPKVGGILNRHSHDYSYLYTYHVTRSDVQLHGATFQHHTEHQKSMIGCNKTVRGL